MKIVNVFLMSKSTGNPLLEMNGPNGKGAEITSAKTSAPDFANNASQGKCSPIYGASGHLVYVRRKPEVESSKSSGCGSRSVGTDCDPVTESSNHDEAFKCREDLKEPENKSTDMLSTSRNSSVGILDEKPSLTFSSPPGTKNIFSPSECTPHITGAGPLPADKKTVNFKQLHERYCDLQDVLRALDQSNQDEYIQLLRSLSSVELNRHAVDLEKRAIQLTFEEAKELQRAFAFNVLESYPENE
ncbi:hypothetical protein LIER_00468 [Lithospermum erythrorhizon]|uniref:Uncharacterized protein n=1 Tax=Lithospermum erythrorhizon TaxID=34254 RepID=A0AAV3NIK2_LITER